LARKLFASDLDCDLKRSTNSFGFSDIQDIITPLLSGSDSAKKQQRSPRVDRLLILTYCCLFI